MPTHLNDDEIPVVQFDPQVELSPFLLFRHLRDERPVLLWDVRPSPGHRTLRGAVPYPGDEVPAPTDRRVVLFDEDGSAAVSAVRRRQTGGDTQCRALFGGLDLYEFALDPQVVGQDTYLEVAGDSAPAGLRDPASER